MASAGHNHQVVLSVYRSIFRATRLAFQDPEDHNALLQSRMYLRDSFEKNRSIAIDSPEAHEGLQHAKGVAQILRENVVQGSRNAADTASPLKLRMHEHIERGDNETIKKLSGSSKSFASMKS